MSVARHIQIQVGISTVKEEGVENYLMGPKELSF